MNQGPIGYEPTALTTELYPRITWLTDESIPDSSLFWCIMSLQMLEKIKNYTKHPFAQNFRDTRFLGFLVFGILAVLASWSGVNVIEANYALQKDIAQLDQKNQVDQLSNSNLKLANEYYNTDTYLELQARKAFGKGAPGETLLLVPRDVAYKHARELPSEPKAEANKPTQDTRPGYKKNLDAWMGFLFHRSS